MKKIVKLNVTNQTLTIDKTTLVSQTKNVYECEWNFSEEWNGLGKTAVFFRENKEPVEVIIDENNVCPMPLEAVETNGRLYVGVYGSNDEQRYPTIYSQGVVILQGCEDGREPIAPTPSVYDQLMAKYVEQIQAVANEKARAEEIERNLARAISEEMQSRVNHDEELAQLIAREKDRAIARENEIEQSIPSPREFATVSALNEEIERAKSKEQELDIVKANKSNTYTKQEVDQLIEQATPEDYEEFKEQVKTNKGDIETINQTLPSLSLVSETGNKVDLEIDSTSYELVAKLYDKNNNLISTSRVIDLPLETLVLNVEYDNTKKAIIITLKDGTTKEVPVSDLVSGLVNEETFNTELAKKQNTIADLETIRSGASKGATAVQDTNYVHTDNNFTTQEKDKLNRLENYDDTELRNKIDGLINDETITDESTWSSQKIADKINDIELAKFPNVTIIGQPTIQQGQISNFSRENYCQFPFIVNFQNQPFTLDFEITTGSEVTQQHNVFDSAFGLAFAVRQSRFVVAISTNGTSWDMGEGIGTHVVSPNSTYRVKMEWDKTNFVVSYSTNGGQTYIVDITKPLASQPYPKQMFIGITSDKSTIFNGSINLNFATLTIANKVIWLGMDDAGLALRANVSLSNLDEDGIQKVKDIITTEEYEKTADVDSKLLPIAGELTELKEDILDKQNKRKCSYEVSRWLRFNPQNRRGLVIKGGTSLRLENGKYYNFETDTSIDLSSYLGSVGTNYNVYLSNEGVISAYTTNKTDKGVKIGRFSTLCANVGTVTIELPAKASSGLVSGNSILVKQYDEKVDKDFYDFYNKTISSVTIQTYYDVVRCPHPLNGFVAGDILPESVFCLSFFPTNKYEDGQVYDKDTGSVIDIYLQSGNGDSTRSVYNAIHQVSRQPINHQEDMRIVGKRLLTDHEFTSCAIGSNERTNIIGLSDKGTVGGHVDTSGRRMISAIGCEECCGYLWQWLDELGAPGGSVWETYDGHATFGKTFGVHFVTRSGGSWYNEEVSGSRARSCNYYRSDVYSNNGCRGSSRLQIGI